MSDQYPRMRYVDAFPVDISGQRYVYLRDPLGMSDKALSVTLPAFFIITLLDGQHSAREIQLAFTRQFGDVPSEQDIEAIIRQLDEQYLLDNGRYQEYRRGLEGEFRRQAGRPAWHAGKVYPTDADECRRALDGYFLAEGGPGRPGPLTTPGGLLGAIAPHIDLPRGGWCFAWAYKALAEACDADLFIIFGTAHGLMRHPFGLTRKAYETPFGPLPADPAFIDALLQAYDGLFDPFEDEFEHRSEHSIEFQVLYLQYLFGGRRPITAVPILCGSMHESILQGRSPAEDPRVSSFTRALRSAVADAERQGRKVFFLSGADLAHMGPRFGDPFETDAPVLQEIEAHDRQLLEAVERVDAEAFFRHIEQDKDRRRVCGYPPIYTMLSVMNARQGRLLQYGQRTDEGSAVTFASMAFY